MVQAVDKELERRIVLAKKDPQQEPIVHAARAAQTQAQAAAREALNTRYDLSSSFIVNIGVNPSN